MARQFSLCSFLRRTPNALLSQYFKERRIPVELDWPWLRETETQPIVAAMEELDPEQAGGVNSDFAQVFEMASVTGIAAIMEEARREEQDWTNRFAAMGNDYERAIWTFLNEPQCFAIAGAFHDMDRVSFSWHRFVGTRLGAQMTDAACAQFGAALAAYYQQQGRGRHCHVDAYRRSGPERYCFFAYPEDAARSDLGYDNDGRFTRRSRQSAFEVIFVYRPEEGVLDLFARGGKAHKDALAEIFCMQVLGLTGLPDATGREPFDLSVLKDPEFPFRTDPRDRIQSVDLRLLRLDLPGDNVKGRRRRILFEAQSGDGERNAVHALIRDCCGPFRIAMNEVQIGRAKLCITFRPVGTARSKTLTFEVAYPDRCTLKDDHHDQIARKNLREWGIASNTDTPCLAEAG